MKNKREITFDWALTLLLGAIAIFSIRSLFQSDSSKIISNDGNEYIQDRQNLIDLNSKIAENEISENKHKEIVI